MDAVILTAHQAAGLLVMLAALLLALYLLPQPSVTLRPLVDHDDDDHEDDHEFVLVKAQFVHDMVRERAELRVQLEQALAALAFERERADAAWANGDAAQSSAADAGGATHIHQPQLASCEGRPH